MTQDASVAVVRCSCPRRSMPGVGADHRLPDLARAAAPLRPDLDPSWRFISEYGVGAHGWLAARLSVSGRQHCAIRCTDADSWRVRRGHCAPRVSAWRVSRVIVLPDVKGGFTAWAPCSIDPLRGAAYSMAIVTRCLGPKHFVDTRRAPAGDLRAVYGRDGGAIASQRRATRAGGPGGVAEPLDDPRPMCVAHSHRMVPAATAVG